MPDEALDLLDYALARHAPQTIMLERDDRLDAADEILDDVARIRARIGHANAIGRSWQSGCWIGRLACSNT